MPVHQDQRETANDQLENFSIKIFTLSRENDEPIHAQIEQLLDRLLFILRNTEGPPQDQETVIIAGGLLHSINQSGPVAVAKVGYNQPNRLFFCIDCSPPGTCCSRQFLGFDRWIGHKGAPARLADDQMLRGEQL
ncbi:hypothetical protein D3C75_1024340 [compost metagenome]